MQVTAMHWRDDPIVLGSPPVKPPRFHFGLPLRAAAIWSDLERATPNISPPAATAAERAVRP
jgi:4-hydroxy-3-polyprenylbenzoate decarboxylase